MEKHDPAAFRRLCVETTTKEFFAKITKPAAFRRLCVETAASAAELGAQAEPAAFRRLCVETAIAVLSSSENMSSRLQAAVC